MVLFGMKYDYIQVYINFYIIILYMPTVPGGQKRLLFTGNVRTNLVNKYTPGSGVGALSASTRRALKRRANAGRGTLDSNGNLVPSIPKPCCPVELVASQKIPSSI
jgi:hypothetical protein